jgi:hypothetical protein
VGRASALPFFWPAIEASYLSSSARLAWMRHLPFS